jgi:hypothetical protein
MTAEVAATVAPGVDPAAGAPAVACGMIEQANRSATAGINQANMRFGLFI